MRSAINRSIIRCASICNNKQGISPELYDAFELARSSQLGLLLVEFYVHLRDDFFDSSVR